MCPADELLQPGVSPVVDRGDEHALDALLLEQVEMASLASRALPAVADDDHGPGGLDGLLGAAHHIGEEGVGHVEDDDGDGAAVSGAQLAGGVVADVAELLDRVEDAPTGRFGDHLGPVEHVAHRAERDARLASDLLDARRVHHSSSVTRRPRMGRRVGITTVRAR